MSNPFSPNFAGAATTTTTTSTTAPSVAFSSSSTTTTNATTTMAPNNNSIDFLLAPSTLGSAAVLDPYASTSTTAPQLPSEGAYGGATWTSPIEIKKRQQAEAAAAQQRALLAQQEQALLAQQQFELQQQQQQQALGLAGLASPPPLPTTMGGTTGSGYNSDTSSPGPSVIPEEDEEYLAALRAAYDAKALMEKQTEEQKRREKEGVFGGLGNLIPKQPNFLRKDVTDSNSNNNNNNTDNNNNNNKPKQPWFQPSTASPTRDTSTPPWHSSPHATRHAATSDFGIPPPPTTPTTATATPPPSKSASIMGASVVGGVAGLMLMGPLVGVVGAGAAAYAAGTKEGPVGSILRGTGSLAASGIGAAKRFDDKHKVISKTASGVATGVGWVVKTVNGAT